MVDATPKPQPRARKASKRSKAGKRSRCAAAIAAKRAKAAAAAAPRLSWNEIIAAAWATDRADPAWEPCGSFTNSEGE